uniref:Uncharacterized protein n=1 Tax=Arundo donax TaxID=35708 RepID=A0A0A9F2K6_ARUDO
MLKSAMKYKENNQTGVSICWLTK